MYLYLITSKLTYSRAVVAAPSEKKAREMRPDEAFWRDGEWKKTVWVGRGFTADYQIQRAPKVDWWPESLDDVEVTPLGRADSHVAQMVWANEPSTETRIP